MDQLQSLENHGLNSTSSKPHFEQTYSKTSDLEIILLSISEKIRYSIVL